MAISRKSFIKSSSLLLGGILLGTDKSFSRLLQDNGLRLIRDNAGIFTKQGGTIGWFFSDDAAVVVDSQMPEAAKNFMESFKQKTSRKIDYLFNTHHHGDHTSGNYYLKQFADKIVAHENCPKLQKKAYADEKGEYQVYADTTFSKDWSEDFGKEKVTAKFFGEAHTGGDSIIHFEKANVVHMGDLVFNQVYPYIDQNGGGSIKGWINVLGILLKEYPDDAIFIFGHASDNDKVIGGKKELIQMKNYLSALIDFTSKEIKAGKSLDEVKKANEIPDFSHLKARRATDLAMNIEAAFNELKKS